MSDVNSRNTTSFPQFLCIGAQKAGTTWLHENLRKHPDIWLSKRDELHFFDSLFPIESIKAEKKLSDQSKVLGSSIARLSNRFTSIITKYDLKTIEWERNYRKNPRDEKWYSSLFLNARGKVTGDFTPDYALLDEPAIKYAHSLLHDAKIIFILRDPIERAWSHAKMDLCAHAGRNVEIVTDREFIQHFNLESSVARGNYATTARNWISIFGKNNVLFIYQDEISSQPMIVLNKIATLLSIGQIFVKKQAEKRIHSGLVHHLPDNLHRHLFQIYKPIFEEQELYFGETPSRWLKDHAHAA